MCGRYTLTRTAHIVKKFNISFQPSFNITPSQNVLIFNKTIHVMRWGYTPNWSKAPMSIINARNETLNVKPAFKEAKRCVFLTDGWFEWKKTERKKEPYFFHLDGAQFFFGGIFNNRGCAIVTLPASQHFKHIHHRQPVILEKTEINDWLNGNVIYESKLENNILFHPISTYVNSPLHNSKECIRPV